MLMRGEWPDVNHINKGPEHLQQQKIVTRSFRRRGRGASVGA
jgi:hypothetical protein